LKTLCGDRVGPWDQSAGQFNRHDRVLLDKLRANFPRFSAHLASYFAVRNVIDEFPSTDGSVVLVNVDARVRDQALRPYPALYGFYRHFAPRVMIRSVIGDPAGNKWIIARFDHGRILLQLAIKSGMLVPLDVRLHAHSAISLDQISQGRWQSTSTITLDKFDTRFGLSDIAFTTSYRRVGETLELKSQMDSVPQLVAPPVLRNVLGLMAGDFLRGLAWGHGGMTVSLQSARSSKAQFYLRGAFAGELRYAPMLGLLAEVGDAIAEAHNEKVRDDERRIGEDLFDALFKDYNDAREQILSLDSTREADLEL
jgi:hypothetical protein